MKTFVVALGGNALGDTPEEQKKRVTNTAKYLVNIIEKGNNLVITHGNGPQVGAINLAFAYGNKTDGSIPEMPLPECTAMSQGYIGFHIKSALETELKNRNIKKDVVSVITQIEVDKKDPAFKKPTKPIGRYYTEEEHNNFKYDFMFDERKGYRRIVASPKPVKILEIESIKKLVKENKIVICCGGGGIPVVQKGNGYIGVDAVIDKDFASSTLANDLNADKLFILTAIDNAKINFRTPEEKDIETIDIKSLSNLNEEGHFQAGSMKPKIEACLNFVKSKKREAIITSLENIKSAIEDNKGTHVIYKN